MALNNNNNFLQSDIWRKFQEAVGHRTFHLELKFPSNPPFQKGKDFDFLASIIEHQLPVVGKYLYTPRGPLAGISNFKFQISNEIQSSNDKIKKGIQCLMELAKKDKAGWIRVDPESEEVLNLIRKSLEDIRPRRTKLGIWKAPHDMQPREILVMDITKLEEELLAGMKSKTRYNINLSQKRGVIVKTMSNDKFPMTSQAQNPNGKVYINEFVRLVKLTAKRKGIEFHPENYYRKMIETIPEDILRLYVAEYDGKIVAANLVIFYGNTATYLHGATDDEYRNMMAPYLLQWQAMKDAKKMGYAQYDLGGVCSGSTALGYFGRERSNRYNPWAGITKFKLGFAPETDPLIFPGSYDIIIDKKKYYLYRIIQKMKGWIS